MAKDYDVVILGAGAAGLSAGLYSTRAHAQHPDDREHRPRRAVADH